MTMTETATLMAVLKEAYPAFYRDKTKDELTQTIAFWTEFLSDADFYVAQIALKRLIVTCKFPPTIAEMRESIASVTYTPIPDGGAAWGEVNAAIRRYGYYREAEALASMSEHTRLAVQRMGWRDLCLSENDMADRAHFLRIYETVEKRANEQRRLPLALRECISAINEQPKLLEEV